MVTPRLGRKTGPKPKFTSEDAVMAALRLGIDRFTIAGVATQLGVATSAVYRLFDSRDALVHACLAHAGRSMTPPPDGLSWQDILRHAAEEVWACCEKYPGLDITIFQFPSAFTHIEDYLRNIVGQLVKTGLGQEQAAFAFDFIGDTTIACHIGVAALRQVGDDGRTGIEVVRDRTTHTSIFVPDPSWTDRGTLDRKVEFIIRGMEREVEG